MTDAAPNVLVVDDEVQIRRFLRSGFELDGYAVSEAESGQDASDTRVHPTRRSTTREWGRAEAGWSRYATGG